MHLARTSNSQEFIELKLESDLEAKIQFLSLFSQNMTTEVELRARLLQQPFLTPDIAMSVLNESLNFAIDGSIDRLVPFDILTDILEIIPRPELDTLLDQLETAKVKFMKLSGPFEFIKENNLDSVHRQLALAYIDASKRLSGRQDEEVLGRLAVFCFQIFPVNPKLVQSKANKVSKVRLEIIDNESYKSLWTLLNHLHDPLELFSYDSKLKNYKLAGNDKEGVAFREVMNLADSVLSTFETIENSFNLASNNSDSDEKAVWREEFAAAENESEFHPLYLGAPNIFDYLLKSSGFRQQVLIQLGIFVHFLQYAQLGTLSKVQVHLDEKQKQWISQVVVKIKSRIEGTIQLSRNWKSFGLELLFRHELEWDKFKNTEFIDAKEPEDVEMKAEEPTAPKKASKMKFKKTGIERVFKDTPDFEELKQRAENAKETFMKSLDDYMYDLDGQVGEDCETLQDDIEQEYVLYNDPVYNWTATRAAVGSNLGMFLDSDIENKRVGKTVLKQWRKYQKQEFAIDKNLTIPLRMRDAINDKVQMEVDLQN